MTVLLSYWLQLMFLSFPPPTSYIIAVEAFGKESLLPIFVSLGILIIWFPIGYWILGKVCKNESQ